MFQPSLCPTQLCQGLPTVITGSEMSSFNSSRLAICKTKNDTDMLLDYIMIFIHFNAIPKIKKALPRVDMK